MHPLAIGKGLWLVVGAMPTRPFGLEESWAEPANMVRGYSESCRRSAESLSIIKYSDQTILSPGGPWQPVLQTPAPPLGAIPGRGDTCGPARVAERNLEEDEQPT
jgi:hypothetical protein